MIDVWLYPLLFAVALAAGFVDAVAGGGGLLTLPVLLNLGIDPRLALGTNKLQGTFGSASASWHFLAVSTVRWADCVRGFWITLVAAVAGAGAVQFLDRAWLARLLPVLLIGVIAVVLLKPNLGARSHPPRMPQIWFDLAAGLVLGFYDGFFGPGTGTFWALACVWAMGLNLTQATGRTKVMNFASNLGALGLFAVSGQIDWGAGLVMGVGQLLGAQLGARMVIQRGFRFIRPIFLVVVFAITARLIYQHWRT